jgi:hypothetical protein
MSHLLARPIEEEKGMNRKVLIILTIVVLGAVAVFVWHHHGPGGISERSSASNFEECAAQGNPVGESYPRQCWTPDGGHFVEEIGTGNSVGEFWGTILGNVLLGPTCPVVMDPPDPQCADKPYQTSLAITTVDGARVLKEFSSREDGTFSVEMPPGEYAIRSAAVANILPYCQSAPFTLAVNGYVEVAVSCDTGIR